MDELRISYGTNWQKNHWKAIESAYNKSPFFEFYKDAFIPFYEKKFSGLLHFNTELLKMILDLMKLKIRIGFTKEYIEKYGDEVPDRREQFHPKPLKAASGNNFKPRPYRQVFSTSNGFLADTSMVDLLFCLGPAAKLYLEESNLRIDRF